MHPSVQAFFDPATNTVSYIVHDPATKKAAIIDPVLDFSPRNGRITTTSAAALLAAATDQSLDIIYLLETHAHADHLSSAHHLREVTGAPVIIGAKITQVQAIFGPLFEADDVTYDGAAFDRLVEDGDTLPLGDLTINVLHTPGHTPACVTYVILDLPLETRIFVGHDYLPDGRTEFAWESTVADQRAHNVHVHDGISEGEFIAKRMVRDKTLEAPMLILPSLQVNIRAGGLPPATPGGHVYLRLPINAL